jgi:Heparinase II/III-like protein/Heparinase II/III N-terminus
VAILAKARRILRGDVSARVVALEAARRARSLNDRRRERAQLTKLDEQPARLREKFARLRAPDLLAHFQSRVKPKFLPGIQDVGGPGSLAETIVPPHWARIIDDARRIVNQHCWTLLGFGEKCFGESIEWNRDPLSGFTWPLDYHADINLIRNDGSDARVLWELNRLAHFITLGRAYALTKDSAFSKEFFRQLDGWRRQNPTARGINWNCAMEVALRVINLLAAFHLFRGAPEMNGLALRDLLGLLDRHGAHIQRNLEFSHIANSNHYLADVTGLLWLGVMLPELRSADEWRDFGLRELLREMDEQTLPDGADHEASTGYHRLKTEMCLYSFVLCHLNGIDIEARFWTKLRGMLDYIRAYVRPDGFAPLVGDTDSGQFLPFLRRRADDHSYLLALGAAVFHEPRFKFTGTHASGVQTIEPVLTAGSPARSVRSEPEELFWILGERGVRDYETLPEGAIPISQAFPDAGCYILRQDDLYLLFNASESGIKGRGSHGHNDALSIEVSAGGTAFIVDPGSFVYTRNLNDRHLFRSTAYHSTVQVDGVEQNTTEQAIPFVIGNEARPRVLSWETTAAADSVTAEHYGYQRLRQPVIHRRTVQFNKGGRFWLVEDEIIGEGTHDFAFRFHCAPGLEVTVGGCLRLSDHVTGSRLFVASLSEFPGPELQSGFVSTDYGAKQASIIGCWSAQAGAPQRQRWAIIPLRANEDDAAALELIAKLRVEPTVPQNR